MYLFLPFNFVYYGPEKLTQSCVNQEHYNMTVFSFQVFECLISFAYVLTLAPLQP